METIGYVIIGSTKEIKLASVECRLGEYQLTEGLDSADVCDEPSEALHTMERMYDSECDGLSLNIYPVTVDLDKPMSLDAVKRKIALDKLSQEECELLGIKL